MTLNKVLKAWANMIHSLEIDLIAPQYGTLFKGKDMVEQFINWCDDF